MSNYYLGIDLGTTYSAGAYVNDQGEAETIVNSESEKLTPSVVYIEGQDSVVVGQPAKDNACIHPDEVIELVKNSMGKKNSDGSPIVFSTKYGAFTPEVISGFILRDIVADANAYLHPEQPIKDVVVTIPAYFNEAQRTATDNAISIAGLNRIGMINEPTAAAFYYASKAKLDQCDIMVYDLGGGTFDVTIVHVNGTDIEVKSTGGLNRVGGSYFDKKIADKIFAIFEEQHGIDLTKPAYADVKQDVLNKVEKAKIQLSSSMQANIIVRADQVAETYTLTRDDLNEIVADLYAKTESVMKKALKDASLTIDQIDRIILVGGSSRIPYIYEHIKEFAGKEPSREVNPNEVVALGAALFAKQKMEGSEKKIKDVCSHAIGIRALDAATGEEYNDVLIAGNATLPASVEKIYKIGNDTEQLYINVLEGEYREITDVTEICEVPVPLPKNLKPNTLVHIRVEMDVNQLLHIYLRIPDAGNVETEISFDKKGNLSAAEVAKWKKSVEQAVARMDAKADGGGKSLFGGLFGRKSEERDKDQESVKPAEAKSEKPKDPMKDIPKPVRTVMEDIVGMDEVREGMRNYKNRFEMTTKRTFMGHSSMDESCIAIMGAPGVGLTTAADRVAQCLYKMGIVTNSQPVWADYDAIVKADEQQTTEAIKQLFTSAENGVLIIDEFHTFYSDNENFAGMLAVNLLQKAYMEAGKKVIMVVVGYTNELKLLFEKKEKFARAFSTHTIEIMGYSADEYVKILHKIAADEGFVVDSAADEALERNIKGEAKLPGFSHIHYVQQLLDRAKTDVANQAAKLRHAKDEDYQIIRLSNFQLTGEEESLEDLLAEMRSLVGLEEAKAQVEELIAEIEVRKRAEAEGRPMPESSKTMHMVFQGSAGTGKTTMARLIGKIYRELGVLTRGHMVEAGRSKLVSEFVGKTAQVVNDKVQEAMGGILFIDEAYSLCRDENDSFGQEAVDALVPLLEDHRKDFICIIAGYTNDMHEFLDKNEGLESRFPNVINFSDYKLDELMQIFHHMVESQGLTLEGRAEEAVRNELSRLMKNPKFGNARGVRNLFERMQKNQGRRIQKLDDWGENEQLILRAEDVGSEEAETNDQVEKLLEELDAMTGLESVKKEVHRLVNLQQRNRILKERGLKEQGSGTMHMVFSGSPGTGKTTVARMIGKLYRAIGVLSTGQLVETSRGQLVAGYIGQTAPLVEKTVARALGGVLFIDEAYQLSRGGENDYGQEAIDTLVAQIENHRSDLVCIVAGYEKDMEEFLEKNEGLGSRFTNRILFEDYTLDEKLEIFQSMAKASGNLLGAGTLEAVRAYLSDPSHAECDGNGRGVRNLMDRVVKNMSERQANGDMATMTDEELISIMPEDVY